MTTTIGSDGQRPLASRRSAYAVRSPAQPMNASYRRPAASTTPAWAARIRAPQWGAGGIPPGGGGGPGAAAAGGGAPRPRVPRRGGVAVRTLARLKAGGGGGQRPKDVAHDRRVRDRGRRHRDEEDQPRERGQGQAAARRAPARMAIRGGTGAHDGAV